MPGMLYLCATPIGNLEDITLRVLRVLKEADLIAAEDTRNSIKLLNHYDIHTPMTSYHEYNRFEKADELVGLILEGKTVACITDAGTPGISDPGEVLAAKARAAGIPVSSLPGATACITALTMSGLPTRRFAFEAFLPADKKKREQVLSEMKDEYRTIVLYEAPHHLKKTLQELLETLGNRRICLCKELTKRYEDARLTTIEDALAQFETEEPRGEYVLVLEGADLKAKKQEEMNSWNALSPAEHVKLYLDQGLDKKEAMKRTAKDRGVSKRDIYQALLEDEE